MRVAVLQPGVPGYRVPFFEEVSKSGVDLKVFAPRDGIGLWEGGYPFAYEQLEEETSLVGMRWQKGLSAVADWHPDLIVCSSSPRLLSNYNLLWRHWRRTPVVAWGHLRSAGVTASQLYMRSRLFACYDGALFYNQADLEIFRARLRLPVGRPFTAGFLNNGLDLRPIRALRKAYEPARRGKRALMIGRLSSKSCFELIVAALSMPVAQEWRLEVIGDAPQDAGARKHAEAQLGSRVTFHGRLLDEALIAEIANECLVGVYGGAVGLSLIHYMCYGLPPIVHGDDSHHMPEIDAALGVNQAFRFRRNDPASLAQALEFAGRSGSSLASDSLLCVQRVDKDYNVEAMSRRFVDFCSSVLCG